MNKKKTIIIGLLIFVICLGIGFAAFSTTLKINGSAKVSPKADNYKVLFASSVTSVTEYSTEDFYGTPVPNTLEPSKGTFTDDTTFTNTGVTFTEDGQSIDYKFYILNAGKYDAHITNLDIGKKTCTPGEDADASLAASACSSINLSVILGDEGNQTTYTSSQAISEHVLPKGTWEQIIVRITYPEGSPLVDGELDVKWENIKFFTATNPKSIPPKPDKTKDPTYCFISTEPGVITEYRSDCSRDVIIPEELELPTSHVEIDKYRYDICVEKFSHLYEKTKTKDEVISECKRIEDGYNNENQEDIKIIEKYKFFDGDYVIDDNTSYYHIEKIGKEAFSNTGITSIVMSNDIIELGEASFSDNESLTRVSFGTGITIIPKRCFQKAYIENLYIPDNVTRIEFAAFEKGVSGGTLEIGKGITYIGQYAFCDDFFSTVKINVSSTNKPIIESNNYILQDAIYLD